MGLLTSRGLEVSPLRESDRPGWEPLARGYKEFYETVVPDEGYEAVWQRLIRRDRVVGAAARLDGQVVGIVHYLFHAAVWTGDVCYLQDLFVDETLRGRGIARALIEHVAAAARSSGSVRLYWQTKEDNATARALYDRVAAFHGFIRYDYDLRAAFP